MAATSAARRNGLAPITSAAAPATSGDENDVPLANPYRPAMEPGSTWRGYSSGDENEETALKTFWPGAARDTCEPTFEKNARPPPFVDAPTESPRPPRPFEPTGCRSAAGYSTGLPSVYSLPAAATTSTPCR